MSAPRTYDQAADCHVDATEEAAVKVYIVMRGSCCDRRIEAVFSAKDAAEAYVRLFGKPEYSSLDEMDIEEHDLDSNGARRRGERTEHHGTR